MIKAKIQSLGALNHFLLLHTLCSGARRTVQAETINIRERLSDVWTPNDIDILIHYCCTGGLDHDRVHAPAVQESIEQMVRLGLLIWSLDTNCWRATELGRATLAAMCKTPIPQIGYFSPDGMKVYP